MSSSVALQLTEGRTCCYCATFIYLFSLKTINAYFKFLTYGTFDDLYIPLKYPLAAICVCPQIKMMYCVVLKHTLL